MAQTVDWNTDDQSFSAEEYEKLGRYLIGAIGAASAMGHDSARSLHIYVEADGDPMQRIVLDAFEAMAPGAASQEARERMAAMVDDRGVLDLIAAAVMR